MCEFSTLDLHLLILLNDLEPVNRYIILILYTMIPKVIHVHFHKLQCFPNYTVLINTRRVLLIEYSYTVYRVH